MNQKLAKELERYLEWKRDKELYPPRWSPEEYTEYLLDKDARGKLIQIYNIYDNEDPDFLATNSNALTAMIEEILYDNE